MPLTYDIYNETDLGHAREASGQFVFGPIPEDKDATEEVAGQTMMALFQFFSAFAKVVVDSIQTQSFPYDLLRRMMHNNYDETEVVTYQTNIIMTCVVVLLIMLGIIVVVIVYTVRHWRQRKRNNFLLKKQLFDQRRGRILIFIGFFMAVFNMMFLMLSFVTSSSTMTAVTDMDKDVTGGLDGVSGYFSSSDEQWHFMSNDTNIWSLISVLQSDVADVGSLIWQPAVQGYSSNLNSPFTKTSDLDSELSLAVSYLNDMQNQINSIVAGAGGNLTPIMSEIYFNLSFGRTDFTCFGCDGSCLDCQDIIVDDIYYNMDFTTLTNVTSYLQDLQALTGTIIAESLISPEYYFWKGIGDVIESNVPSSMDGLNTSLAAYSDSISASTDNLVIPNETVLKFDRFRSDWTKWYTSFKGQEGARYAFHVILGTVNIVMLAVLYFGWALLVLPGLVKVKPQDDNFKLPRRIILICLISGLAAACGLLIVSVVGFYGGANTHKAICEPTENETIIRNTVDYSDAIPGHDGLFLSSIVLGNGTLYPLYVSDTLEECRANNTTAYYTLFHQDLVVPKVYTDLVYAPFFVNMTTYFDDMLISLPNVTLVPPLLEDWYSNFTNAAFFNLTEYVDFLAKGAINANLASYVENLLTVYNTAYPDGPKEPAKSRLYEVSQSLLSQESALNEMNALKNNVSDVFFQYKNLIESIQSNVTSAISTLKSHESAVQSLSASYISSGVGQHRVTFAAQLLAIEGTSQTWITEIGPCPSLPNAYDMVYDTFCNKFSDNANATWMLVGITVFFLLLVSLISFLLYREIPEVDGEGMEEALDIKKEFPKLFGHRSECCCCCIPCCCFGNRRQEQRKRKYKQDSRPESRAEEPRDPFTLNLREKTVVVVSQPPEATKKY